MYILLATKSDGTETAYGPFPSEEVATHFRNAIRSALEDGTFDGDKFGEEPEIAIRLVYLVPDIMHRLLSGEGFGKPEE